MPALRTIVQYAEAPLPKRPTRANYSMRAKGSGGQNAETYPVTACVTLH